MVIFRRSQDLEPTRLAPAAAPFKGFSFCFLRELCAAHACTPKSSRTFDRRGFGASISPRSTYASSWTRAKRTPATAATAASLSILGHFVRPERQLLTVLCDTPAVSAISFAVQSRTACRTLNTSRDANLIICQSLPECELFAPAHFRNGHAITAASIIPAHVTTGIAAGTATIGHVQSMTPVSFRTPRRAEAPNQMNRSNFISSSP